MTNLQKKFLIFLDFDGVLHSNNRNSTLFEHGGILEKALTPYIEDINIILSTSWRIDYPMEVLQSIFTDNLKDIIIDITPNHQGGFDEGGRYKEIKAWLEANNFNNDEQWIAIDDIAFIFPKDCPNLIKTNPQTGLDEDNINAIVNKIQNYLQIKLDSISKKDFNI